jgi:hypothetical protein
MLALTIAALSILFFSCGNGSPSLSKKKLQALFSENDTSLISKNAGSVSGLFDISQMDIPYGIKYEENRTINSGNPPVVIDLSSSKLNTKELDVKQLFSSMEFVSLKHPFADSAMFLYNTQIHQKHENYWMSVTKSTNVIFTGSHILTSDIFGINCFNADGSFSHAVCKNQFDKTIDTKNKLIDIDMTSFKGHNSEFLSNNHIIAHNYFNFVDKEYKRVFHDLKNKKSTEVDYRPKQAVPIAVIVDKDYWIGEYYTHNNNPVMLCSFGMQGDTLCEFSHSEIINKMPTKSYPTPLSSTFYFYNGIFTYNHAYNDTVFRMTGANRLTPAFVMNWGDYKVDINDYVHGKSAGKMTLKKWIETPMHILLYLYHELENGMYYYAYFDKQLKQVFIHAKTTEWNHNELINNSLPGGLPISFKGLVATNGKYIAAYTKELLNEIIGSKSFASLSEDNKTAVQEQYNKLNDDELLVMILQ